MKRTFKTLSVIAAAVALAAAVPSLAAAQGDHRAARGARANPEGGVTAGSVRRARTEDRRAARVRGVETDGQGAGRAGSVACAEGPAGAACRAGRTEWTADGGLEHESGARWETTAGGSGETRGSFVRNPDGTYAGERTTSATGANGATYDSTRTVDSETGYARSATAAGENGSVVVDSQYQRGVGGERTVTCFDSSGAVVTCPSR